jgi:hypothetical protein
MDLLPTESLFSRQGKATAHMHPEFSMGPKPRPVPKVVEPVKISDLKLILTDLEKKRADEENDAKNRPNPLTSSFRAISRDSYQHAFRNRTESPNVSNYTPRYNFIKPRATHALKIIKPQSVPKERVVFIPSCLQTMACSFANRILDTPVEKSIKRNAKTLTEYNNSLGELQKNFKGDIKKTTERLRLPISFNIQRPRPEFVKGTDPPNDKRFDYIDNNSPVNTKHKRISCLTFDKILPRKELFEAKNSLSPYDADKEFTQKKISTTVLEFSKMVGRKPLVNEHMLKTPGPIDNQKIQSGYLYQSTVRG